jgi:serine protease Do
MSEREGSTRRRVLGALASVGAVGVAGCSSGGESTGTPVATTSAAPATETGTAEPTATATATPDRPNIERQVILRDQAAILHVRRSVTGEIVWPSFEVYNLVDPALLGVWVTGEYSFAFRDDRTFVDTRPDAEYEGEYAAVDGLLVLTYEDGSEFEYEYEIAESSAGVELTLTNQDGDSATYTRESAGSDDRDVVTVFEDTILLEESNPTEEGGEIQTGSAGSGFCVHPDGYVVTNAHVVGVHQDPSETLYVRLAVRTRESLRAALEEDYDLSQSELETAEQILYEKLLSYYVEKSEVRDVESEIGVLHGTATPDEDVEVQSWHARVEAAGEVTTEVDGEVTWGRDVAILKVDEQVPMPTVPLGNASRFGTGERSFVIGYPNIGIAEYFQDRETTLEPTLTSGVVSARRTLRSGIEAIQTDAGINNGNSGGPIYNGNGEVVGIATFKPTELDVSEVAFGLPIDVATPFLDDLGVEPQRGELDAVYEDCLNALWRGDCEDLESHAAEVRELWPEHPYVGDLVDSCGGS